MKMLKTISCIQTTHIYCLCLSLGIGAYSIPVRAEGAGTAEEIKKESSANDSKLHFDQSIYASQKGVVIMGTIAGRKSVDESVVLLKFQRTNKVKAFRVGHKVTLDEVNYTISHVRSEFFIVKRIGPKSKTVKVMVDGFGVGANGLANRLNKGLNKGNGIPESYREEGFEREKNNIRVTAAYRDRLVKKELGKILMQASAEPIVGPSGIEGFMLDQIEPESIYQKAGLINGDIVTSINGIPLKNVTAAIRLLRSLKNVSQIDFEIKRGKEKLHMKLKVD